MLLGRAKWEFFTKELNAFDDFREHIVDLLPSVRAELGVVSVHEVVVVQAVCFRVEGRASKVQVAAELVDVGVLKRER